MENTNPEEMFFNSLKKFDPPKEWISLSDSLGVLAFLVHDPKLPRSIRRITPSQVYISIGGAYWKNYQWPPLHARSYEESILLKFLHELGHVYGSHQGTPGLTVDLKGISPEFEKKAKSSSPKEILEDPDEKSAWDYALSFRSNHPKEYESLLNAYSRWYADNKMRLDLNW